MPWGNIGGTTHPTPAEDTDQRHDVIRNHVHVIQAEAPQAYLAATQWKTQMGDVLGGIQARSFYYGNGGQHARIHFAAHDAAHVYSEYVILRVLRHMAQVPTITVHALRTIGQRTEAIATQLEQIRNLKRRSETQQRLAGLARKFRVGARYLSTLAQCLQNDALDSALQRDALSVLWGNPFSDVQRGPLYEKLNLLNVLATRSCGSPGKADLHKLLEAAHEYVRHVNDPTARMYREGLPRAPQTPSAVATPEPLPPPATADARIAPDQSFDRDNPPPIIVAQPLL